MKQELFLCTYHQIRVLENLEPGRCLECHLSESAFVEKKLFIYKMPTTSGLGGENVENRRHIESFTLGCYSTTSPDDLF